MKNTFTNKLYLIAFLITFTFINGQETTWNAVQAPVLSTGEFHQAWAAGCSTDADDNTYISCTSDAESIAFGSETFTNLYGNGRSFVVKYNSNGNVEWIRTNTSEHESNVHSSVLDSFGNLYVLGSFFGTATFEGTTLSNGDIGQMSVFLLKYNAGGDLLWAKQADAAGGDLYLAQPSEVAIDANSNLYISGSMIGTTMSFGNIQLPISGEIDFFIAKYDENGNPLWARKGTGKTYLGDPSHLKTDSSGNVYVIGTFQSATMLFGSQTLTNDAFMSIFFIKYDAAGNLQWAKKYGNIQNTYAASMAIDSQQNIYAVGVFNGTTINFDTITLSNASTGINGDIFVAKFNAQGNVMWAKSAGSTDYDGATEIITDAENNIYVGGNFRSPELTLGAETLINGNETDNTNSFIFKMTTTGDYVWTNHVGGNGTMQAGPVSLDSYSNLNVTGNYHHDAIIGSFNLSTPSYNMYFAKLHQNELSVIDFTYNGIDLYPNPVKDILNVGGNSSLTYIINDLTGRTVTVGTVNNNALDVSALPTGMYILNIDGYATKFIKE